MLNKQVPKSTICRLINVINKRNSLNPIKQKGRPRSVRTKQFIYKIKRNLKINKKKKSAELLAKENGCSGRTVRRIIHDDLALKTYKKIKVPALSNIQQKKRKTCATWFRKNFTHELCRKIMFSDEKLFDGDGQLNPHNDIVYAESREDANNNGGLMPKHKYPYKVMIWVGLTYNGVTDIVVLPKNESFNTNFYVSNVLPIVKTDGEILIGKDFSYQQDGASCHTSFETLEAFKNAGISVIKPNH